ncbi:hypothetical protein CEXT_160881 [Caerostris extrusa]|uniref:Uncharacterized protein n=1 Tax=Caerostris extrusa TaxID=172846 RepID=A0AAV4Y8F5_CAEEX|nr:hypothetical protein CEXT_160881 [Caerostris extrusa]
MTEIAGLNEYSGFLDSLKALDPIFSSQDTIENWLIIFHKCYAIPLLTGCIMDIDLLCKLNQCWTVFLLIACGFMTALSQHLIKRSAMVIFLIGLLLQGKLRGNVLPEVVFLILNLYCCFVCEGYQFVLDLYLIICYIAETVYSARVEKDFSFSAIAVVEIVFMILPISRWFKVCTVFFVILTESVNYQCMWQLILPYFAVSSLLICTRDDSYLYNCVDFFRYYVKF